MLRHVQCHEGTGSLGAVTRGHFGRDFDFADRHTQFWDTFWRGAKMKTKVPSCPYFEFGVSYALQRPSPPLGGPPKPFQRILPAGPISVRHRGGQRARKR
jgi:hypothetical protein